jgi:hypothetical protein
VAGYRSRSDAEFGFRQRHPGNRPDLPLHRRLPQGQPHAHRNQSRPDSTRRHLHPPALGITQLGRTPRQPKTAPPPAETLRMIKESRKLGLACPSTEPTLRKIN